MSSLFEKESDILPNSEQLVQYNSFGLKEFVNFIASPSFVTATKLHEVIIEKHGLYQGAMASRTLAATKYVATFQPTVGSSKARKFIEETFNRIGISEFLLYLNNALGPGASLLKLEWDNEDLIAYEPISPEFLKYIRTSNKGYQVTLRSGTKSITDLRSDVLLYTPKLLNPYQKIRLGMVWKAALPYFLGSVVKSNWLRYTDSFGKPFRNAKLPKNLTASGSASDPRIQQQLESIRRALKLIGQDGYSMLSSDVELELFVSAVNANPAVFDSFIKSENDNLLIAIQGQTLTTLAGGNKADSEVKFKVKKELLDHDLFNLQSYVNSTFIPILCEKAGIEARDYPKITFKHDDSLDKSEMIDIALRAKLAGFNIDPKWFEEQTGIKLDAAMPVNLPPDTSNSATSPADKK